MPADHAEAWAAAVPSSHGRGARHNSDKGVDRMPPRGADFPCSRAGERGARDGPWQRRAGSSGPASGCPAGGRAGLPKQSDGVPTSPQAESTAPAGVAGSGLLGALVFHAIAVSSNDDRLPVMHQPIDHGGGQGVVHVKDRVGSPGRPGWWRPRSSRIRTGRRRPGTAGPHRVCRWADSPAHRGGEVAGWCTAGVSSPACR